LLSLITKWKQTPDLQVYRCAPRQTFVYFSQAISQLVTPDEKFVAELLVRHQLIPPSLIFLNGASGPDSQSLVRH
jgi:hypothetical protein